jgi:hypothetical protein
MHRVPLVPHDGCRGGAAVRQVQLLVDRSRRRHGDHDERAVDSLSIDGLRRLKPDEVEIVCVLRQRYRDMTASYSALYPTSQPEEWIRSDGVQFAS